MIERKIVYVLFFIVFLIAIVVGLIAYTSNMDMPHMRMNLPGSQTERVKRNCDVELTYSVLDEQCQNVCAGPGLYRSHNGICVNLLAFDHTAVIEKCEPHKGLMAFMMGNSQLGTARLTCLSVDPGIQPDDITKDNIICIDGTIDIDYLKEFPIGNQCKCPEGKKPYAIANTSQIRTHTVCASSELEKVFTYNNLLLY